MAPKTQPRQPKGVPVGGQFAGKENPEPDIELDAISSERWDIHRPAAFNPEDYEYVDGYDNQPEPGSFIGEPREYKMDDGTVVTGTNFLNAHYRWLHGLLEASQTARYGDGFQCDHCGARIRYVAVYRHKPTGDHIAVGETCADGRLPLDKATFQRLRKQAQLDRQKQRCKKAAREAVDGLEDKNIAALLDRDTDPETLDECNRESWDHHIVSDIRDRLWTYGAVSERQVELVTKIRNDIAQRGAVPDAPPDIPVPEGTLTIMGTIKSTKYQKSPWGGSEKMLVEVKTPNGNYRVWGSLPKALDDINGIVGQKVQFKANFERSSKDESFGFFKRPTQVKVLDED
ncbi:MAG: hypothetical protein ACYDEP_12120 [Acidimicrobiales bacterium]